MIELKNIYKSYSSRWGNVSVLNDINLTLPDHGLCFILGKSGSGKSTLINLISGIVGDFTGEIFINGINVSGYTEAEWDIYRGNNIGIVFQDFNLVEEDSVLENLLLPTKISQYNHQEAVLRARNVLGYVGMEDYALRKICRLSGGQKQRIAIARALMRNPSIILADEPTGNLDSKSAEIIFELLKKLSSDHLVCVVSHDEASALRYADRILVIKDGFISERIQTTKQLDVEVICDEQTISHGQYSSDNIDFWLQTQIPVLIKKAEKSGKILFNVHPVQKDPPFLHNLVKQDGGNSISPKSLPIHDAAYFAFHGICRQKAKNFVSILLAAVLLVLLFFSVNLGNYNTAVPLEKYYQTYSPQFLTLDTTIEYIDTFYQPQGGRLTSGPIFKSTLNSIFPEDSILPVIAENTIEANQASIDNVKLIVIDGNDEMFRIVGRLPHDEYEVVLTDYIMRKLNMSTEDIGAAVTINGVTAIITGILITDYEEYDVIEKIDSGKSNEYLDYRLNNYYLLGIVGSGYVAQLQQNARYLKLPISDIRFCDWESRYLSSSTFWGSTDLCLTDNLYCGRLPQYSQEILISYNTAINLGIDVDNFSTYAGEFIDIYSSKYNSYYSQYLNINDYFPDGYVVVGVYYTLNTKLPNEPQILVQPEIYAQIAESYFNTYIYSEYYVYSDENYSRNTFEMLNSAEIKWTDISAQKIYSFANSLNSLNTYLIIATLGVLIGWLCLCTLIISYNIREQTKLLGIMRTVGFVRNDLRRIYLIESLIVGIVSIALSLIVAYTILQYANFNYATALEESPFVLLSFKAVYTVVTMAISLLCCILFSLIPILKMTRKKPFDLIHP